MSVPLVYLEGDQSRDSGTSIEAACMSATASPTYHRNHEKERAAAPESYRHLRPSHLTDPDDSGKGEVRAAHWECGERRTLLKVGAGVRWKQGHRPE